MMATRWGEIILLVLFFKSSCSLSDIFPSKPDLNRRGVQDKNIACPSLCNCNNFDYNLTINCSFKNYNIIPNSLNSDVYNLDFEGNNLSELAYNTTLKRLTYLNVKRNNISIVNKNWLGSLQNLIHLDVSRNFLSSREIENVFKNMSLLHLDLSHNRIMLLTDYMFEGMDTLLSLNLSFNGIRTISLLSFSSLTGLNVLDLSNNKLVNIQHELFNNFQSLKILFLKHNNLHLLRNVMFANLKHLQHLDLSENNIKSIGLLSFKGLVNLEYLNISDNPITHIQEGVFRSLESLNILDISKIYVSTIDNIFIHSQSLVVLFCRQLHNFNKVTEFSFSGLQNLELLDLSGSPSLSDISIKAFLHLKNLRKLDVSHSNVTNLKIGLFNNLDKLETLKLSGNPWKCDCYLYWLLLWLGAHTNTHLLSPSEVFCQSPSNLKGQTLLDALDHNMICTNAFIHYYTNKTKFKVGLPALLECNVEGNPLPSVTWITPQKSAFHWIGFNSTVNVSASEIASLNTSISDTTEKKARFFLTQNGNLAIKNVERGDGGFYVCIASNPLSYDSIKIRLTLDYEYFAHIKIVSILVGMATSFGFLLLTLISILIKMILKHFGIKCLCHSGNASPRTQQIKKILESMEHYKKQQLDRLLDNYNVQVQRIKDNCMQQMERLRESYSSQAERLRDIKEYGTLQIDRIRDNYYSQVQRVRDYSASQIIRLRENYIYQRNRIRKFSAHHLYKLRENYKVQQQHLNKILENLNIESCRNVCQRTDSVVFEPEMSFDNVLVPKICLQTFPKETCDSNDNSSQISAYFTPDEADSEVSGHESDEHESLETNSTKLKSFSTSDPTLSATETVENIPCIPAEVLNKKDVNTMFPETSSNGTIV